MIKLAIVGYGKMGKSIEQILKEKESFHLIGKYDIDNPIKENLKEIPDVAIEFSTPDSVLENIEFLASKKINTVCGTTGWYKDIDRVKKIIEQNNTGFIYASNFSIGVNIFFQILKNTGELINKFKQYTTSVEEAHHIHKLDKPSGTAIKIAEILDFDSKNIVSNREGVVFGEHSVIFESDADSIELSHSAKSRRGFAEGALKAAEFIHNKKGFYKFEEIFSN